MSDLTAHSPLFKLHRRHHGESDERRGGEDVGLHGEIGEHETRVRHGEHDRDAEHPEHRTHRSQHERRYPVCAQSHSLSLCIRGLTPRLCHLSRAGVHFTHTVPHSHYTRPRPLLQVRHIGKRQWERILTPPKKISGKTPGQRGRGKNVKGGAKRVPPLTFAHPNPASGYPCFTPSPFVPMRFCSLAAFSVSVRHTETREIICLPASPDLTKAPERIAPRPVRIIPGWHRKKIENGAGI